LGSKNNKEAFNEIVFLELQLPQQVFAKLMRSLSKDNFINLEASMSFGKKIE
jgi:hypothetical protein